MKKSRKFISMPIVSLEEGLQIGTVRNLVIDPVKMEIAAIIVDQRGWFREQKIIPYTKIKSIGNDAITVDQSSSVQRTISLPQMLKLIKEKADPIGTKVITENGIDLGVVDEYYIDETSGSITGFEISGKFPEGLFKGKAMMPADNVRTLGSDVIAVKEGTETSLQKLEGGLNETIHSIKESTTNLWESTKQRTKVLSKNIKEKYEKKDTNDKSEKPVTEENLIEPDPALDTTGEVEVKNEDILEGISDTQPVEDLNLPEEDSTGSIETDDEKKLPV